MARQSSERGDTLVEVLLALIILSIAGVALLAGFATAISSSGEHRNLASLDSSDRMAANMAIADIQQQAGQSNDPFACPDLFTPSFSNVTGDFQVTVTSVGYWNGSTFQSGCIAGAAQQYTLTITSTSSASSFSTVETTVITDPGAPLPPNGSSTPYQLAWVQQPTSGTAYAPVSPQPEVAVENSSGDIVTSDFSSVTLNLVSGPSGGTISTTCSGVESYGIVQFSDCSMSTQGSYGIQAVDGSLVPTTVANVSVTGATATKLAFSSSALTGTASGSATLGPITVQEEDAFGDPVPTTAPVTVSLSSSSTGTNEFAATSGGGAITSVTIPANSSSATFYYGDTKAGSPTLTAAAAGLVSGTQSETITATTASKLAITSSPFSAASSSSASTPFTVTLEDTYGNATAKTSATTVNLTSTSSGAKFAATSGGTGVTSVNLPANTSSVTAYYGDSNVGTPTITAAATNLTSGTQQETITTGPTKLVLTGPATGSASATASLGPFTVTEEAANGTPTTVGETVNLTSSSAGTYIFNTAQGSTGPTGATSVTIPSGQSSATFYYGDTKSDHPTITAAATGLTSATQQETISAGAAAQLVFTTGTVSGTASANATVGPITVQEQDAYGNVTTTALTVNLTSASAGPYEFAATSGGTAITSINIAAGSSTATFYYGDENSGTPVITAAATGLTSGSQYETINAGTGTQLAITSTAFTGTANASATNSFTVTLEDTYGNATSKTSATTVNLTSTSTGTHKFAASSGGAAVTSVTLPANTSSVTAYYGDETPGTPTITAAATGLTSATQQEAITAGAPAKLIFTTSPVSGNASNSATLGPITVEEQDAYGNVATSGSPTTVTLTSTSAGASFASTAGGAAVTSVTIPGSSSTATFYYGDTKAGNPTITATMPTATVPTSATQQETITALPASQLGVSTFTATASASATNAFTVTLEDTYGNAVTFGSATTVNLTSTSTGTHEFAATSGGTAVTSVPLPANTSSVTAYYGDETAGTPTITATNGTISGASAVTITAKTTGDTLSLVSGNGQSAAVGAAFANPLVVQDADQYGNLVSGVTVTFTPPASGASGTFTTSATAVTGSNGQATSNTYTANTTPGGPYNVVASATGASSASFPETNVVGAAHTVTATSGSGQSATVATAFTNKLVATVTDQYGNPVSGVTVTFTPPGSGASGTFTTSATAVTNSGGVATSNTYTANTTAGSNSVVASATGASSANFSETNTAKTTGDTLSLISGSGQSATVATAFINPLVVQDVDQYGNLVSGVTVTFTVPASGASGTFTTSATAVTGSNGQATSNTYTANTTAGGPYNVLASASGATPTISFSETNTAKTTGDTLSLVSGNGQSATVGSAFANPLVVKDADQYGNLLSGVTVTLTPPASGASGTFTTSSTAITNASGVATSNTYTANTTAGGPYNVVASATGAASASFPETNVAGAAHTLTATSGSGQSATVAAAFTNPLVATVADQYGNPVSGVTVTFTPPASGSSGTFTSSTAVSNASGVATSSTYTANTTAGGPYNVVASATGVTSVNFSETNTAKTTGDTLSLISGSGQSATVATAFTNPLVVKDVDQYGNLVSGVTVTFTAPGSGASGTFTTSATAVTGSNGQATSNAYTANTTAGGAYNVVASATGATPTISFPMTNVAGAAHTLTATSGSGQSAMVGAAFANPLVATVTDQYGNPVSGVTVTFTPPASGASGSFTTSSTAVTNASGVATSNTYTANTTAGTYSVVASATGVASVNFSETNKVVTASSVASGTGTTSVTSSTFAQTNGSTYLITAYESSSGNGTPTTPTPTVTGGGTPTAIVTNNFGGTGSPNCTANDCYEWSWWYNARSSGTATVSLTFNNTPQASVVDVVALAGNSTTTPIVAANTTTASSTSTTAITANTANAPTTGDITLQILASDDEIGTSAVTWSPASTNLYFRNATTNTGGASLQVNSASPGQQNESASALGFGGSQDWGTIALEIGHS
jgi:hypothetical protein